MESPTETEITPESDERKGSEAPRNSKVSECQRLLHTRVDLSDYEVRAGNPSLGTLEGVRELLCYVENALERGRESDLAKLADLIVMLQGLDEEGAVVRYELERVERAILKIEQTGGVLVRQDEPIGRTEKTLLRLCFELEQCDKRYGRADLFRMLDLLKQAAESTTSTGNKGRGNKGHRWVLENLMADTGAHGATSLEHARKIVAAKRPKEGKTLRVARPRLEHNVRLFDLGNAEKK